MWPNKDEKRAMLKLAQFILLCSEQHYNKKAIELILQGVDLNFKVLSTVFLREYYNELIGSTLVHLAYEKNLIDVFNILIRKGADFNVKDQAGLTVLHKSFQAFFDISGLFKSTYKSKLRKVIKEMNLFIESILSAHVENKDMSNASDPNGLTYFHIACATNNIEAVEFFLCNGVPINQAVSSSKFAGYTALHFAVEFRYPHVVGVLLEHGANVNLKNGKGKTPLHVSLGKNIEFIDSTHVVLYKFAESFSTKIQINEKVINLLLCHGDTEFSHLCAVSAMQSSFQAENLLSQEVNVNQSISMDSQSWPGYTALHFAAHVNVDTVKLLVKHGANIEAKAANGVTPFDMCIDRYRVEDIFDILCLVPKWKNIVLSDGKTKLVDLLIALKDLDGISNFLQISDENVGLFVPFDSPLWPGFTVLHVAVLLSEREKCKLDYNKNREDYEYEEYVFDPDLTIIAECLEQGADVTVQDHRSWTPIHLAFRLKKENTRNLLMRYHRSAMNCVDEENLSHLHIACAATNWQVVERLLSNGADVNIAYKGKSSVSFVDPGWIPLHIVSFRNYCEGLRLLLKFGADPHVANNHSFTAIHDLVAHYHPHERSKLLFRSASFRDCTVEGVGLNYLHVACWTKNVDAVKKLLDLGTDIDRAITCENVDGNIYWQFDRLESFECFDGYTPLHCTLRDVPYGLFLEQEQILSLLIERGADLLVKDSRGIFPLQAILDKDNKKLLEILIAAFKSNHELRRRVETEIGLTMLHLACHKVDVDLLKEFLDCGADVDAQIHEDSTVWPGCTPLHVLMISLVNFRRDDQRFDDFGEILKLLLDRRADVTLLNTSQHTPLHIASYKLLPDPDDSSLNHVSLLLKAYENFEVNPTTVEGISHFHIACHMLDVHVVENFLEHGVDVNSTIDMFYKSQVGAKSPLLLAIRKINSSQTDSTQLMAKSLAQLKIVDLLIKHGADVAVEDVFGNTAAHYAATASSSFARVNLLQRLANSGVDVNARNVQGKTPLELLMKQEDVTVEEIRYFIVSGCVFNAFNPVTEEGYIALAASALSHEEMQYLLFGTFVNFPDMVKRDHSNRTAVHNIVSSKFLDTKKVEFADFFDTLMTFGCDIDDQDNLGRTPLHLAALFRNLRAVEGLLSTGADLNKIEKNSRTPFLHLFERCHVCSEVSGESHNQLEHFEIFEIFVDHIEKLKLCHLEVSVLNDILLSVILERFEDIGTDQSAFLLEVEKMKKLKIKPYELTLQDFMSDDVAVVDYPTMSQNKRNIIREFFKANKNHFSKEFEEASGVLQLQYRKTLKRQEMINMSTDSLTILTNFRLPDLCLHRILRFLRNSDLENLIVSTFEMQQ